MVSYLRMSLLFMVSAIAGWLFEIAGIPLPWMLGPLVSTALIFISGKVRVAVPDAIRPIGQVIVACQVGLTFSAAVLRLLLDLAPIVVGTALMTGVCIFLVALLQARIGKQSLAQAFLSGVPTSPVEAAAMAVRLGVAPVPVIFSQTMRLSMVVLVLPLAFYAIEGWPLEQRPGVEFAAFDIVEALPLFAIGIVGMVVFRKLRVPNPNFLGPLSLAAVLAVNDIAPAPFSSGILAGAQIILGTWLGSNFRRSFISSVGGLALGSVLSTFLIIALCSCGATLMAMATGMNWHTLVLGAAPGGLVEMALTAKFLGHDVALITAFHLTRIFIFMPSIPWMIRGINWLETRKSRRYDAG